MITVHQYIYADTQAVLWLLEELNQTYELVYYEHQGVQVGEGEGRRPLPAMSTSLVLVDGDVQVSEMGAIFEYLLATYDTAHELFPESNHSAYFKGLFWFYYAQSCAASVLDGGLDGEVLAEHVAYWDHALEQGNGWFMGGEFSAVDMLMSGLCVRAFEQGALEDATHVRRLLAKCQAVPSWGRAQARCRRFAQPAQSLLSALKVDGADYDIFTPERLMEIANQLYATDDGGNRRGVKTRQKLAEALLTLIRKGELAPTVEQIAQEASVSRRNIFHHFEHLDLVYAEAIKLHGRQLLGRVKLIDGGLPLEERIDAFVKLRADMFEFIFPVRQSALLRMHESEVITESVKMAQFMMRMDVTRLFAREFEENPEGGKPVLLTSLEACSSWSFWQVLREQQELSVEDAQEVLAQTLLTLCT